MSSDNVLLGVALIAVLVSAVGAGFTYYTITSFKQTWLTGFVTSSVGTANLTVESTTAINFTTNNINWGSGRVNLGSANATLDTSKTDATNVTNGNWTGNTRGFVVENIGNNNVSLNIKTAQTAAQFVGGTSPAYQFNVSNNEAGSCLNSTGGTQNPPVSNIATFQTVNTTDIGTLVCDRFPFTDAYDAIRIDLRLVVPSDSKTGALSDVITATAT